MDPECIGRRTMSTLNPLLVRPGPASHLVQLYGGESVLVRNVAGFLKEGAAWGDAMIVIATPSHRRLFAERLKEEGVDADALAGAGRLVLLDAQETLSRLMVDGRPDAVRFQGVVGDLIRATRARTAAPIRAYGEMVDLLWKAGELLAAGQLEELWNALLERERFSLFCAYTVDLLSRDSDLSCIETMLGSHSHLLPVGTNGELDHAVQKAMEEVLGAETIQALKPLLRATQYPRPLLPGAEATVLWLRRHVPPYAEAVLARARLHYEALCRGSAGA
jgi:hypothetical protein